MVWWMWVGSIVALIAAGIWLLLYWYDKTVVREYQAYQKNAFPAEQEQLLGYGALMQHRNQESQRLLLAQRKDHIREGLIECWGIIDAQSARETIQGMINGGRRGTFDMDFAKLLQGARLDELSFDGEDYVRWERAMEMWKVAGLPSDALQVRSMAVYDHERIAWLARNSYALGYLTEQEVWGCLIWVHHQVSPNFSNWTEYAASYLLGRATTWSGSDDNQDVVDSIKELLTEQNDVGNRPYLWQQYQLSTLSPPEDLGKVPVEQWNAELPPPQRQLLGFGVLTAQAWGDFSSSLELSGTDYEGNEKWLARAWGVTDKSGVGARMDWLLGDGERRFDSGFSAFLDGRADDSDEPLDAACGIRVRHFRSRLLRENICAASVERCQTLLAYDLERAAYLARLAHGVGYLEEGEAWSHLRRIARMACSRFGSWEEYFVSHMLGCALFHENTSDQNDLLRAGTNLLFVPSPFVEFQSPWQLYPLEKLTLPRAIDVAPASDTKAGIR